MQVPSWQVFSFNFIKKPFFSSLWYVVLVYLIWNPTDPLPSILGVLFLITSFTTFRFHLAMLSPLPCIASAVLSWIKLQVPYSIGVTVIAVVWLILYFIAIFIVNARLNLGQYVISPITNRLLYSSEYYLMKGLKK